MSERVAIIGQGYVGLPVAMRAVDAGYEVVGFDVDEVRIAGLSAGRSHVEDVTDDELSAAIASGRYSATAHPARLAGFDIAVISVPTPLREGVPDLTYIEGAAATLAQHARPGTTVILESTTYPGTTEELVGPILEEGSGLKIGADIRLGYSPERIDPGNAKYGFRAIPKVVSGVGAASLDAITAFYDRLVDQTVPVSSPAVAELTKLLENTFRHVNIALVNELAMYANDLGIDVWEAIDAASTKPFGYMRFTPGPGVGGHCLPVDPSYLAWQTRRRLGRSFRFVELANDVNENMPDYVVRRLFARFNDDGLAIKGRRILLLGLSYKRNTGDARESPSMRVAELLVDLGADVRAADPHVSQAQAPAGVPLVEATDDEVTGADAVIVLVDHDAFDLAHICATARLVFDTKNVCPGGENVEKL